MILLVFIPFVSMVSTGVSSDLPKSQSNAAMFVVFTSFELVPNGIQSKCRSITKISKHNQFKETANEQSAFSTRHHKTASGKLCHG